MLCAVSARSATLPDIQTTMTLQDGGDGEGGQRNPHRTDAEVVVGEGGVGGQGLLLVAVAVQVEDLVYPAPDAVAVMVVVIVPVIVPVNAYGRRHGRDHGVMVVVVVMASSWSWSWNLCRLGSWSYRWIAWAASSTGSIRCRCLVPR